MVPMQRVRKGLSLKTGYATAVILAISWMTQACVADAPRDYSLLTEFIVFEDREKPLFVLADPEDILNPIGHKESITYFNEHPEIIRKIRSDLGGGTVKWRLDYLDNRQMFVPEKRAGYASLFENYCHDVIEDLLEKTKLENPYHSILTLRHERPELSNVDEGRVNVFLVHNLIKEFDAGYVFSNSKDQKVKIELNGKVAVKEVGSYSSHIFLNKDGGFEFTRDNHTVWQNSAQNPYTALMTPMEETLHIILRASTENAIKHVLVLNDIKSTKTVKKVVNNWMAVEEAIVGGEAYILSPPIVKKYVGDFPHSWIEKDIESKSRLNRYRYLKLGINLVSRMGYQKALSMYMHRPRKFFRMLFEEKIYDLFES